jgi:hypothetical protein
LLLKHLFKFLSIYLMTVYEETNVVNRTQNCGRFRFASKG